MPCTGKIEIRFRRLGFKQRTRCLALTVGPDEETLSSAPEGEEAFLQALRELIKA